MGRQFWLAVAAYLVPTFPLGYFWHLSTFKAQYERLGMYREQVIIPFGLTSMVMQSLIFAWVYPQVFGTGPDNWVRGMVCFAGIFGGLSRSFTTLPVAAKYRMSSVKSFMLLETGFTVLQFAVVSPLIAWAWRAPA